LRSINPAATKAEGYAFLTEIVTRTAGLPLEIGEVPIAFVDRKNGKSKMSIKIILESMLLVTRWGIRFQLRGRYQ
jgi:dolichol-phosphate mannosyltransferase